MPSGTARRCRRPVCRPSRSTGPRRTGGPRRRGHARAGILLEGVAFGDAELEGDEVEGEECLRDRVLDLEAGVHLQEVRPAVRDEELDGPGAGVVDGAGGTYGEVVEFTGEFGRQARCRGLLDHLLVAALEGAVPGAERPHRAVGVGEDLHLDVAAVLDVGLHEHLAVAEGARRLRAGRGQFAVEVGEAPYDAHAASAAARRRLHQDRQVGLGDVREGAMPISSLARLGRHRLDRLRRRSDPGQARVDDGACEAGVLGEEAVAGVDGVGAGGDGGLHDQVAAQVGVGGGRARQSYRRVGHARVEGVLVGVRVHGDDPIPNSRQVRKIRQAISPRLATRTVLIKVIPTSGRRRSRRAHPRRARCGRPTDTGRARSGCRAGR